MTPDDRLHRARDAERLANEPFLIEAMASMERKMIDTLIEMKATEHDARYLAVCKLTVIRGFRSDLQAAILDGQEMDRRRPGPP
ncbi:MAG: hypothetical protein H0W99_07580 [Acidobacteria bacterium]|nr:hypothetical protein [Acidobacteriota bacterium]